MRRMRLACFVLCCCLLGAGIARAHFGMVIPSESTVMDAKEAAIRLDLRFWHPFENRGMHLDRPASFRVFHDGKSVDLLPALKEGDERGLRVWSAEYALKRPGLHAFVMEPSPYFEKEEDCFIVHLTKVYVDAFGDDDGWDEPLGLQAEIVPLTRPGALYAGNLFQGRVLLDGKPAPGAEVEVEWYPGPDKQGVAPYESMVTQTVKADDAGIFSYAAPLPGWWGFAALLTGPEAMRHDGQDKAVELGAVFWVRFHAPQAAVPLGR